MNERARVQWQCRRGMRELDLLLQDFFEGGYNSLDAAGRAQFEKLLSYPDALLLDYLMGRTVPSDPLLAKLVFKIRGADSR